MPSQSSSENGVHASVNDLRRGDTWEVYEGHFAARGRVIGKLDVLADAFLCGGNWWIAVHKHGSADPELVRAIPLLNRGRRL